MTDRPATTAEALAHIEKFKQRLGWEFPSDPAPPPARREPKEPEPKQPEKKRYERCGLCENLLKFEEQPDGVCVDCLRRYQTTLPVFAGPDGETTA